MNSIFRQNIISLSGEEGKKWLENIPQVLKAYERKWSLTVLPPYQLSYNYVAPVILPDKTHAVIKIGSPGYKEFKTEFDALKIISGEGAVNVLRDDIENNVLLLEHLQPGKLLSTVTDDQEVITIAVNIMKKFWKPVPSQHSFPSITDWGKGFEKHKQTFNGTGPLPKELFERAEATFHQLSKTSGEPVLLHGDLHFENILSAERQPWLAIDPKGIIGEREYETGALLRNNQSIIKDPNVKSILKRRIDQMEEELEFDRARIIGWGFSQAMLSAIWGVENHGKWYQPYIEFSELLSDIH